MSEPANGLEPAQRIGRIARLAPGMPLSERQASVADSVVRSRGKMLRPFEVLLHAPEVAMRVADLGHVLKYESAVDDAARELVTLATGYQQKCPFIWESHEEAAVAAGVRPEVIAYLQGSAVELTGRERTLVTFVRELCSQGAISDATFESVHAEHGDVGVIELTSVVGYYTLLGFVMNVAEAC